MNRRGPQRTRRSPASRARLAQLRQRLSSRPVDTQPTTPRAQPTDRGFDWGSEAAGAAGTAGLIALVSPGGPALNTRRRMRTAR
jgi:hypothetical protein